jgi:acyl CoA:acetate/3-ketoacid CoA transferase alpha subunit
MAGTLEERVDEALATARAAEAAIMTVGAAAFDAAEQARRAAELAERASAAMLAERQQRSGQGLPRTAVSFLLPPEPAVGEIRVTVPPPPVANVEDERLRGFNLRADLLADRLRAIGTRPVSLAA